MIDFTDNEGNRYFCDSGNNVILQLDTDPRQRKIGQVVRKKGMLVYIKQDKESQRFRKTDAWSIPYHILKLVDGVQINTDKATYKIMSSTAKDKGDFFHFKSTTEKKIYVPVKHFWQEKHFATINH